MQRQFDASVPELMDRPQPVNEDLRRALRDLAWLNKHLGATRMIIDRMHRDAAPRPRVRLLDVATGGGDIPRSLVRLYRRRGVPIEVDAVDFHPATLALCREFCADYPEITLHQGDARDWSSDTDYNIILCTLALHHFSEADAIAVLRNLWRLARGRARIVVLDLERSPFNALLIDLLTRTLIHNPMTVQDARSSIRAAFTAQEMRELASAAGWTNFGVHRRFPARIILEAPSSPSEPTP